MAMKEIGTEAAGPFAELEADITSAYEGSVTVDDAEKLAAKFLAAMMKLTAMLKKVDLDSRMKKSGLKAVKAAIYMAEATKTDKKPSDTMLGAMVDRSPLVQTSQSELDTAECSREELERYFSIFKEAHVYFRGIAKGKFE